MEIPVLVEPSPTGFRATTGAPLDLSADGPTADAALAALRMLVADRLRAGGQLRALTVTATPSGSGLADNPLFDDWLRAVEEYRKQRDAEERAADPLPTGARPRTLTAEDVVAILDAARRMRENPMYEEYQRAVEEYRREHNTIPGPEDSF
jgi:hypothetical protein